MGELGDDEKRELTLLEFEELATEDTHDPLPEGSILRDNEHLDDDGVICTTGKYSESRYVRGRLVVSSFSLCVYAVVLEFCSSRRASI